MGSPFFVRCLTALFTRLMLYSCDARRGPVRVSRADYLTRLILCTTRPDPVCNTTR